MLNTVISYQNLRKISKRSVAGISITRCSLISCGNQGLIKAPRANIAVLHNPIISDGFPSISATSAPILLGAILILFSATRCILFSIICWWPCQSSQDRISPFPTTGMRRREGFWD